MQLFNINEITVPRANLIYMELRFFNAALTLIAILKLTLTQIILLSFQNI